MRLLLAVLAIFIYSFQIAMAQERAPMRVLVMGDSFMTSNGSAKQAVPHLLARQLGARVKSTAVSGARFGYQLPLTGALGFNIAKQYRKGNWDYVVMNGGGNDLWLGCGCTRCKKRLNRLISPDGTAGHVPDTVKRARRDGARVIYVGYLRSPGLGSPIEHCRKVGDALEARISVMARQDPGVSFVSLADMVPHGDASFHGLDMIHPSPKGSQAATDRIIKAIIATRRPGQKTAASN
ncbi:MAG: SGNH/GDSL hydrolase family protein [Sulfitobacter sp.]|nr:SGNH/GDSL hydrolase family protein [Sulfitobacter sp.]